MVVHTVGLIGANGNVGRAALKNLLIKEKEGQIKLIVFHRPGSAPKDLPSHIEKRELDLEAHTTEDIIPKVKGVHVLIASLAPGSGGMAQERRLIDALLATDGFVSYFPSIYSNKWTEKDLKDEKIGPTLSFFESAANYAHEKRLGTTMVFTGIFDFWFFGEPFYLLGARIKDNELVLDDGQRKNVLPLTSMDHLGSVLADLASQDPVKIKNTEHSAITYEPTGDELVELFTKINGHSPTIKAWNEEAIEAALKEEMGAIKVAYAEYWTKGSWAFGKTDFPGALSLEQVARRFA